MNSNFLGVLNNDHVEKFRAQNSKQFLPRLFKLYKGLKEEIECYNVNNSFNICNKSQMLYNYINKIEKRKI